MPLNQKNRYVHKKYTKLSVEQTIVPGRLHSELCAWGVKIREPTYSRLVANIETGLKTQNLILTCKPTQYC